VYQVAVDESAMRVRLCAMRIGTGTDIAKPCCISLQFYLQKMGSAGPHSRKHMHEQWSA